ncbi:MAG: metallophosphoesterase [Clostridia bacterium]|nr:metallophosphoesterase [Clostridia bacterium]
MVITKYKVSEQFNKTIAIVSDFHNKAYQDIFDCLNNDCPDIICIAGDLIHDKSLKQSKNATDLLKLCSEIAPTFYSFGNHEKHLTDNDVIDIVKYGVVPLDNAAVQCGTINIGGFSSFGYGDTPEKDRLKWLDEFEKLKGYKILLCHHPEYYPTYLKDREIDLVVSGHAHGGQIRLFGKGLFAPGQGIFPKYTKGIYDNKLIVSTGIANTGGIIPRLFNRPEIVYIEI